MCSIISPTTLLLSATGALAFKNCGLSDEVSTFAAPEMLQDRASSTKPATDRVSAYILILQIILKIEGEEVKKKEYCIFWQYVFFKLIIFYQKCSILD